MMQPVRPTESLSLRSSYSTGIRAPGIGELFGGAAREDFQFVDPCSDVLGVAGSANNGHDSPQLANIIANCATLGVPVDFVQRNPQLSAVSSGNEDLIAETSDNWSIGFVYSANFNQNWIEAVTFSADWYDLTIDDAIQGQDPGNVLDACAETLDSVACSNIDRSASGAVGLVNNRLVNIGSIEASGLDLGLNYLAPVTGIGQFDVQVNATYLDNFTEITNNADGSQTVNDMTGTITDQTFQRAFPEWRANTKFGWTLEQWNAGLTFRYVDSVVQPSGDILSSRTFTDARLSYAFSPDGEGFTLAIGANNIFDKDPAVCLNTCGSINMSPVLHDLPGTFGYVRLTYRH